MSAINKSRYNVEEMLNSCPDRIISMDENTAELPVDVRLNHIESSAGKLALAVLTNTKFNS
ncbi:MAG: hypothetical protein ACKVJC_09580 [Flavobacteriales bacterium]